MNEWMDDAACAGEPLDVFFPAPGRRYGYKRARELCARCPVADQCQKFAMDNEQGMSEFGRSGMYAGLRPIDRVVADQTIAREDRRRAYLKFTNRNSTRRK